MAVVLCLIYARVCPIYLTFICDILYYYNSLILWRI